MISLTATSSLKLPPEERNHDIWYDSHIVFRINVYCFKRHMDIGPNGNAWLVPNLNKWDATRNLL
jgi:hypothetical protein